MLVGNVAVLIMPEEQVTVVRGIDFDVTLRSVLTLNLYIFGHSLLPCMHLQQWLRRAWKLVNKVIRLGLCLSHTNWQQR